MPGTCWIWYPVSLFIPATESMIFEIGSVCESCVVALSCRGEVKAADESGVAGDIAVALL